MWPVVLVANPIKIDHVAENKSVIRFKKEKKSVIRFRKEKNKCYVSV